MSRGQDQHESPYEVLAGVVIEDRKLWPLIHALHKAELEHFGCRYASPKREFKAKRLLKTKVFRHARGAEPFGSETRRNLAKACLEAGASALPYHHAALGQAKLAYVLRALDLAARFDCKAFASIIPKDAPRPSGDYLRKDYSYLFERFYFLLREQAGAPLGLVVFDELERSQSHLLIDQMERYFMSTATGRTRRTRIVPEPFFVHSHLTTGIHLADLVAYIISWGVREHGMTAPAREELRDVAEATRRLRYNMAHKTRTKTRTVWGFNVLTDLRPRSERGSVTARET
jgi:Protein of unknown function (DUF3800)